MGRRLLIAACFGLLVACGGGIVEHEVTPTRNNFEYRAVFDRAAGRERIDWPVAQGRHNAVVSWEGTEVTEGEFILVIYDAEGNEVWDERAIPGHTPSGGATEPGTAGDWRMEIEYTRLVGTVRVRAVAYQGQ